MESLIESSPVSLARGAVIIADIFLSAVCSVSVDIRYQGKGSVLTGPGGHAGLSIDMIPSVSYLKRRAHSREGSSICYWARFALICGPDCECSVIAKISLCKVIGSEVLRKGV